MKLILSPKNHLARQACYSILISLILLMLFYILDTYITKGNPTGFVLVLLNIIVVLSWLAALFGTVIGIISIYKAKEISFFLMILLFMGFTFSIFGLLDLLIPTS